jgi:DNA polymerase-3 subunit gamma/tau
MIESSPKYTVLARRYRPQSFDELVGQDHVGQALRNAIRAGRVAHAYLFTGARGVGKTSTARIFAKALNCPHAVDGVPCNQCDVCQSIGLGADVDVLEIDGASNRGIDDIRQLRANVNVRSMRLPYKVYIIDEVHMLTKEAFNALLKTLEEPPPNVKFIFCTTEPEKLPDTIRSRCQRFDFGTINFAGIVQRLQEIAVAEGREVTPEAIELVARRAAGSMRDSQSLFDQLLAFGGDCIDEADVHRLMGTAPDDRLLGLVDALINRDRGAVLQLLEEGLNSGLQLGSFSDQLVNYFRDLLVEATAPGQVPLLAVGERARPQVRRQADRWGLNTLTAAMQLLLDAKGRMQRVNYGRPILELALIRMTLLEQLDELAPLLKTLASGDAAALAGLASRPSVPAPPAASRGTVAQPPAPPAADLKKNTEVAPVAPRMIPSGADVAVPPGARLSPGAPLSPTERPPAVAVSAVVPAPPASVTQHEPVVQQPVVQQPGPAAQPALTAETVPNVWNQVLAAAPELLAKQLRGAARVQLQGPAVLELVFPEDKGFNYQFCNRPEKVKQLGELLTAVTGQAISPRLTLERGTPSATRPAPVRQQPVHQEPELLRNSTVEKDPFVQQVLSLFGGEVVEVRPILVPPPAATGEAENDDAIPAEPVES